MMKHGTYDEFWQSLTAGVADEGRETPSLGMNHATEDAHSPGLGSPDEVQTVRRATEVLGLDHVAHWMRSKIPS